MKGKAWKFGNDISTDLIIPGRFYHLRSNLPELAKYTMEDARQGFSKLISNGDFIVAGNNFGLGSSREHAALVIKQVGIGAVLAKSFARIFFRNAINVGLPVIICNTDEIDEGDELELDLGAGVVRNLTKSIELKTNPLPKFMMSILKSGGLMAHIKKHGGLKFGL